MGNLTTSGFPARRFLISGRVQGVYFRASTRDVASKLGLYGFARNLPDGSVEVVASGATEAMDSLSAWLRMGPPASRVDEVIVEELAERESLCLPDRFETR